MKLYNGNLFIILLFISYGKALQLDIGKIKQIALKDKIDLMKLYNG